MEENVSTAVEQEQTSDSFMEGWDEEPTTEHEADQPEEVEESGAGAPEEDHDAPTEQSGQETAGGAGENEESAQGDQPVDAVPKSWALNHLGEVREYGEADMVVLAQKGLDSERVREKWDEAKPVMELFRDFAKQAGMSVADYVSHIRTQAKQAGGMSEAEARRAVELEDREAAVAAREAEDAARQATQNQAQEASRTAESRRRADILEFQKTFPDAAKDPKSIPREVWADVNRGMSLVSAYSKHAVAQAKAAQQAAEQKVEAVTRNQKNADRSTGSMKTAGDGSKGRDPFMDGFMD